MRSVLPCFSTNDSCIVVVMWSHLPSLSQTSDTLLSADVFLPNVLYRAIDRNVICRLATILRSRLPLGGRLLTVVAWGLARYVPSGTDLVDWCRV
jgi:hypothetical protein